MRADMHAMGREVTADTWAALEEVKQMADKQRTRRNVVLAIAAAVVVLVGIAAVPAVGDWWQTTSDPAPAGSVDATGPAVQVVQEIIEAQAAQDRKTLVDIFADEVVLALPGGAELVGEQAATHVAGNGSHLTTDITGSAVAHDDGTVTVPVTSTSVFDQAETYDLLWTVHLDGDELTRIEEQFVR
jgi:hypothetical protein